MVNAIPSGMLMAAVGKWGATSRRKVFITMGAFVTSGCKLIHAAIES